MVERELLSKIPVLGPWQKTEHHLRFPNATAKIAGFFGLPKGVFVESVKIGLVAYEESGAIGKPVHPGQSLVVVLENKSPTPLSLASAFMELDIIEAPKSVRDEEKKAVIEPVEGPQSILHRFALLFGGGQARIGFRTRELCTLEEIWSCDADLERVIVMGSHFHGESLWLWRGMVVGENTPVEITFTPRSSSKGRAVVRLEKLSFPQQKGR